MSDDKFSDKQQAFIDLYDGNGTEAARKAKYKGNDNVLAATASRLLRNVNIANAIKSRQDIKRKPTIASREERQELWTSILRGKVKQKVEVVTDDKTEIVEQDVIVPFSDRLTAARDLGKSEGDFFDRLKIEGGLSIERKDELELDDMMNELMSIITSLKQAVFEDPTKE